ncbi:MAG TPA: hypothetical protein VJP80_06065 [Candidatus Saccharimonadales bacterium]|nr:hypothetical protein [Candidatus Saccharimonadales bacterium]
MINFEHSTLWGDVYIESRHLGDGVSLSWDIAHHLYPRHQLNGWTIVLADNPGSMLASVRKQWIRIIQKLRKERASTLSISRSNHIKEIIGAMDGLTFGTLNADRKMPKVIFMDPDQLYNFKGQSVHTIYITCQNVRPQSGCIVTQGVVVVYKIGATVRDQA